MNKIVFSHWRALKDFFFVKAALGAFVVLGLYVFCKSTPALADVKVDQNSGLGSKVNGRLDGSCKAGTCRISGGRRSGRKNRLLFHRLSELNTKGNRIKKVKLNLGNQKTKSVILGVTHPKGTFIGTPFILSGKADLILLSPGGIEVNGASFTNVVNLGLAATSRFDMAGGYFNVFQTSSEELNSLRWPDDDSPDQLSNRFFSNTRSSELSSDNHSSFQGSIKISDQLTVDQNLLVVAEQPIKLVDSQLDISGDVLLESRISALDVLPGPREIPKKRRTQETILIDDVQARVSGDVFIFSKSGKVGRSLAGLSVYGSSLIIDGDLEVSARGSSASPFDNSHGISLSESEVAANNIYLDGKGGNSSEQIGNEGIYLDSTDLVAENVLFMRGRGGRGLGNVEGIYLNRSLVQSTGDNVTLIGRGGDDAAYAMDGISIWRDGEVIAFSDVNLDGRAGRSRSPNQGAGIYIFKKGLINAENAILIGYGAQFDPESSWPETPNQDFEWTTGVDVNGKTIITTSGDLDIYGEGGSGRANLDGIALDNVTIDSGGDVELFGVSGTAKRIKDSNGIYLNELTLSSSNLDLYGLHSENDSTSKGARLDGIHLINSRLNLEDDLNAFGVLGSAVNLKDSTGIYIDSSEIRALSIDLFGGPPLDNFLDDIGSDFSVENASSFTGSSSGRNVGLWVNNSELTTTDGDLILVGRGGEGENQLHGIWLADTKLNSEIGSIVADGISGNGGTDMNGLIFEFSDLISGDMIKLTGDTVESETASSNSGIYLYDSFLRANTIKAWGYGGDVTEKGDILDGIYSEDSKWLAHDRLKLEGYAGYGPNISQSNGISLYGGNLSAGSISLLGSGTSADQQAVDLSRRVLSSSDSDNHGVALRDVDLHAGQSLVVTGSAGSGNSVLDGVHLEDSTLFTGKKMIITGQGSSDYGQKIESSDGIYAVSSLLESDGTINLSGSGGSGWSIENSHGVELLDRTVVDGKRVAIEGNGGFAEKKNKVSSGVLIEDSKVLSLITEIDGTGGAGLTKVKFSDGVYLDNSLIKSDLLSINGFAGIAGKKVDRSTGVYSFDSRLKSSEILIRGFSGYGEMLKLSHGVDFVSTKVFADTIDIVGRPITDDIDSSIPGDSSISWGELNQGISIQDQSELIASDDLRLRGAGGNGISQLDGIDIANSSIQSGNTLRIVGVGGSGEDLSSTTGIIVWGRSTVRSPVITMVGRGGRSTATNEFKKSGNYLNDGIYLENSTISSKPIDQNFTTSLKKFPIVLKGYGGEISVEDGTMFDGGDLNSGVVLWNTKFIGGGSSKIKGYAGMPPKGNLNTGIEIGDQSRLTFFDDYTSNQTVSIFGKAYSGNDGNTAVKFVDSELRSPSSNLNINGDGAEESTGALNQGVRFINTSLNVGDSDNDDVNDLFITGRGGRGKKGNSGVYIKSIGKSMLFEVSGSIYIEGTIREKKWRKHPSVFLNNIFLSAGEDLFVEADQSVELYSSSLDAGRDLFVQANFIQIQDSSLEAVGEISLQSENLSVESSQLRQGAPNPQSDDVQSEDSSRSGMPASQSSRSLSVGEIEQIVLDQETTTMNQLSQDLGLPSVQPMGLKDIQHMLRLSIKNNLD